MADDYDGGDEAYWFDDSDYLYVEDEFGLADELAENQVPSPGYSGTNHEIEAESHEWDVYEYLGDLEYGEDSYWDSSMTHLESMQPAKTGEKRKRGAPSTLPDKRRKPSGKLVARSPGEVEENVLYRTFEQRIPPEPPLLERRTSYALLPDWEQKFAEEPDIVPVKSMPADMAKAAEAKDEDSPPSKSRRKVQKAKRVEVDAEEDELAEGDSDGVDGMAALDPEMIKAVLKQKLGAGAQGMDEVAFMQAIQKMLSGKRGAEDELASMLLGQATEEGNAAAAGWLSEQGVSLDVTNDEDVGSVTTAELPEASTRTQTDQVSPVDSALGLVDGRRHSVREAVGVVIPSQTKHTTKAKTTKKVSFNIPPSPHPQSTDELQQAQQTSEASGPPTTEDPLMSETTLPDLPTRTRQTKAANTAAAKTNKAKSAKATKGLEAEQDAPEPALTRQTRKRKAGTEGEEEAGSKPAKKKAVTKAIEPVLETARRTRGARARVE